MTLIDEFVRKNIITSAQSFSANNEMDSTNKTIDQVLESMNVSPEVIVNTKKEYFNAFPFNVFSDPRPVSEEVLEYIPIESAERYRIVPLGISADGELEVGMLDPEDLTAKTILQFISTKIGMPYKVYLISWANYDYVLKNYRGVKGEVSKALGQYTEAQAEELEKLSSGSDVDESDIIREDAPIAKIVSNIIRGAAEKEASDIHIEVNEKDISVRYRVDGVMEKNLLLPVNIHRAVVARIKILSRIKIDEKRVPQDGRFSGVFLKRKIDFRVSTFPTYYGEKVVMRLLEQDRGTLPIEQIGFSEHDLKTVRRIVKNSFGIILVCGPTGSGKTNTLYSLLNEIDKETKNVLSLENPIEMNVPGVSQSQVRHDIGYTFARGLRAVLRQDPDVIMVGEIRDKETASLAIEAALTGHLVLSTIHTNTAADVPQRLTDMGVEPYLIGPTLIASIGQRLIRKIIPESRSESAMSPEVQEFIKAETQGMVEEKRSKFLAHDKMYNAVPTPDDEDGMKGRTAVFEILEMNNNLRRIILTDPSSISILAEARKTGYITFVEDGILKALDGVTTFDEVMKL